jgi:hypothetical protein
MSDTPEIRAERISHVTTSTAYYADGEILYVDKQKFVFGPHTVEPNSVALDPNRIQLLIDTDRKTINELTVEQPKALRRNSKIAGVGLVGAAVAMYALNFGDPVFLGAGAAVVVGYGEVASRRLTPYKSNQVERAAGRIATYKTLLAGKPSETS